MTADGLQEAIEKLRADGAPEVAIRTFEHYYRLLQAGERGLIPESEIEPVADVPDADGLAEPGAGARDALERTIVLKLNGGLGTSMGMTGPKSLVEVKDGLSFLDIAARQALALRESTGARLPLVLMHSFYTREQSLAALARYPEIGADVPLDFVQGRFPKLRADDLRPIGWPRNPELEWAPPGHGDLYTSILTSGMLATLLEHGYEYAMVSNIDNLGAVLDERILARLAAERSPFLMEVAERTEADRKGGHVARRRADGRLVLRELAQTPDEDMDAFTAIGRHRFFNTNTLWLSLRTLDAVLRERDGVLGLPLIVNRKTVDPTDPSSPEVLQLETAMGAAIEVFEDAAALRVSRRRFAPVKTTDQLLALRSDAYVLTGGAHVELAPERGELPPIVELDPRFYRLLRDFEARFPGGAPSLVGCERLRVIGDVRFGAGVVVRGSVVVENTGDEQLAIEDGALLEGP
jgi:UTP--glucose-1-phosphate uridylyltransferase